MRLHLLIIDLVRLHCMSAGYCYCKPRFPCTDDEKQQ